MCKNCAKKTTSLLIAHGKKTTSLLHVDRAPIPLLFLSPPFLRGFFHLAPLVVLAALLLEFFFGFGLGIQCEEVSTGIFINKSMEQDIQQQRSMKMSTMGSLLCPHRNLPTALFAKEIPSQPEKQIDQKP